ncbi:MAG: MBL fold metallo-hydrolase [Clostridia bacterium]|nr:MBL fold metallo-hydrolase [Clostridia bacterium]
MSKFCPLFSDSGGNSTYISTSSGGLLVDVGVSLKTLKSALESAGGSIEEIKAVLITHEHTDHIKCISTLLKKYNIPLIASEDTLRELIKAEKIPAGAKLLPIKDKKEISGIGIKRFATSHDCKGSSGYTFTLADGTKVGVCTDLGVMTDEVRSALLGCNTLLVESNHDIEMLRKGPYPPELKLRIMSDKGHLSNNACAAELAGFLKGGTTRFVLGHLSKHNNLPMLALSTARAALIDAGAEENKDYLLSVAKPQNNEVIYL